ncbi:MAG TPA: hypothetical protein VN636_00630 [Acidimicrobiia bacterium]|nr:hypothetical protein [Acidimicrobiia bacterium]
MFKRVGSTGSDGFGFDVDRDVVADHHAPRLFAQLRDEAECASRDGPCGVERRSGLSG